MSRVQSVDAGAEVRDHRDQRGDHDRQVPRWMTAATAAIYYDFSSRRAFRQWAARNGIKSAHRGRILIFWSGDIDKAIGA